MNSSDYIKVTLCLFFYISSIYDYIIYKFA
jgi:hypothetical protein